MTTMMKLNLVVTTSLLASAQAFLQCKQSRVSTAVRNAFESEVGAQPPLGFFDPLGLLDDGNQETFDRLRYVEIKHGRISMLAVVGYLLTEAGVRWPVSMDSSGTTFDAIPSGFGAFMVLPQSILLQTILTIGVLGKP